MNVPCFIHTRDSDRTARFWLNEVQGMLPNSVVTSEQLVSTKRPLLVLAPVRFCPTSFAVAW